MRANRKIYGLWRIRRMLLLLSFALAVATLSACGFVLRKADLPAVYASRILTTTFSPDSELGAQFAQLYAAGGGKLAAPGSKPDLILQVLFEQKRRVPLSTTRGGLVREYRLDLSLTVELKNAKGRVLMPASTFTQQQGLNFTESETLAKEYESAQIYREMQRNLVQQLLYRLAAVPF